MKLENIQYKQNSKVKIFSIVSGIISIVVLIWNLYIYGIFYQKFTVNASMILFAIYIFAFYMKNSKMNVLFGLSTLLFGIYNFLLVWYEWDFISRGFSDISFDFIIYSISFSIAGIMFLITSVHCFFNLNFKISVFPIIALAVQFPIVFFEGYSYILFEMLATLPFAILILYCPLHQPRAIGKGVENDRCK